MPKINKPILDSIIIHGNAENLVNSAMVIGESLAENGLSTSQIRGIFGTVRRIEMDWIDPDLIDVDTRSSQENELLRKRSVQAQREFALLQPRIVYQAKRERRVEGLSSELLPAIALVLNTNTGATEKYQRFRNFVDFFEAILAYHRGLGGRDS